jgi:enediyne biosynthesis protein E4
VLWRTDAACARVAVDSGFSVRNPWTIVAALGLAVVLTMTMTGCSRDPGESASTKRAADPFAEVGEAAGIRFVHSNGMTGEYYFAEVIGPGIAILDYDNDGRPDILVLQGTPLSASDEKSETCSARLYHNDLVVNADGTRTLKFTDVTEKSKLCSHGYGMGIAVGDFDNDGFVDVFITHFGSANQLFHNNGDGTFTDVTAKAGVAGDGHWGASATFFDYDRDGWLDLYVTNYVDYTIAGNKQCNNYTSARDYCAPTAFPPVPGILYHNRGDGTFENVSVRSGITAAYGNGLGVVAADLNRDGWPDLYVANDGNPNQLWINQKNGTFKNEAEIRGAAVSGDGVAEAGMGVDIADYNGDGKDDIFLTHLTHEKATMYVNLGEGQFADRSAAAGLYTATTAYTGFGTAFIDYDNDGWLDLVIANGAVHVIEELVRVHDPFPLHQKKQLLHNRGDGRFDEVTDESGPAFALSEVGRGLAVGDLDNDGGMDFVVANNNGPVRVFLNQVGAARPWIGLRLLTGKRDAYGAEVQVVRKGAPTLHRRVHADGSYLSSSDPRVVVGLGGAADVEQVVVHWPDGRDEVFAPPLLRRYTTLVEGAGVQKSRP